MVIVELEKPENTRSGSRKESPVNN